MTSGRELLLAHLETVRRVVRHIAKRKGLDEQSEDDLASYVRLRLVENEYAVLRRYRGDASPSTYLAAVVHRFFVDFARERWNRWRPSRTACRLGPVAVELETLVLRDGFSQEEAVRKLAQGLGRRTTRAELERLLALLPRGGPREVLSLSEMDPDSEPFADEGGAGNDLETRTLRSAAERALIRGLSRMDPQDLLILRLRFVSGRKVTEIARLLELEQRPLYRRIERLLRDLREELAEAGVEGREGAALLASGLKISLEFGNDFWKKRQVRPSRETEGGPEIRASAERDDR